MSEPLLFYDPHSSSPIPYMTSELSPIDPKQTVQFKPLHFNCLSSNSKLMVSHSGLSLTATCSEEDLVVASTGFSEGCHYWEIYCPLSCENISVGVIKEGFDSKKAVSQNLPLTSLWQFRTSTPRVIGIKMDFALLEVRCWLNGNFQPQRIIKLTANTVYFPCVKMREKGNQLILNPFSCEPGRTMAYLQCPVLSKVDSKREARLAVLAEKANDVRVFQGSKEKITEAKKTLEELGAIVCSTEENIGVITKLTEASSKLEDMKLEELDFKQTISALEALIKKEKPDPSYDAKLVEFLEKTMLPKLEPWLDQVAADLAQISRAGCEKAFSKAFETVEKYQEATITAIPVLPADILALTQQKELLAISGNRVKLVPRDAEGNLMLNSLESSSGIKSLDEEISIVAPKEEIRYLMQEFPWAELLYFEDHSSFTLTPLFSSLQNSKFSTPDLIFSISLRSLKSALDLLLLFLRRTISKLQSLYTPSEDMHVSPFSKDKLDKQFKEENQALPFAEEQSSEEKDKESGLSISKSQSTDKSHSFGAFQAKLLSIESAQSLFAIVSRIEAQVHLRTKHLQAKMLPNSISRSNIALYRLVSFINYNNSSCFSSEILAEAGLINSNEHFQELRHFLDPSKLIESLQNIRVNTETDSARDRDLYRILRNIIPDNRLLQGLLTPNLSLKECISHLPCQIHGNANSTQLTLKTYGRYAVIFSKDGLVSLWNSNCLLAKLHESDLRMSFHPEKKALQASAEDLENEDILPGFTLFDDSLIKQSSVSELSKKEELPVPVMKIPPPPPVKEPDVVPDPGMIEALYNMGFPVDLAKKALIKVKNADLSMALDTILVIQEEESKNPNKTTAFKSNTTLLKPQWQCHACTFMNINSTNKNCTVCGTQAPIDAFYTEEELNREEEAQKKVKVEQEKMKEVLPVEEKKEPVEEPKKIVVVSEEESKRQATDKFRESLFKTGMMSGEFFIPSNRSKAAGVIVGAAFSALSNDGHLGFSVIRLRRFGVKMAHLMSFVTLTKGDHGFLNNITREWTRDETFQAIEESLFDDSTRFSVEVLDPFFNQGDNWGTLQEIDLEVDLVSIRDVAWIRMEQKEDSEDFLMLILGETKDGKSKIILKGLTVNSSDPYVKSTSLTISPDTIKELNLEQKPYRFFQSHNNDCLTMATAQNLVFFNTTTLDFDFGGPISTQFPIKSVQFLPESLLLLGGPKELHEAKLPLKSLPHVSQDQQSQPQTTQQQVETTELDPQDLSPEEIGSLRNLLTVESLGYRSNSAFKSNLDPATGLFSRHNWLFPQTKPIELSLKAPENLVNMIMDFRIENQTFQHATLQSFLDHEAQFISKVLKPELYLLHSSSANSQNVSEPITDKKPTVNVFSMSTEFLNEHGEVSEEKPKNLKQVPAGFPEGNYIPLRIKYFEGAAYNSNIFVSKLLAPNKEIFITNYYNSFFILESLDENLINVDSLVIQSDFGVINGGFPLGSGLIFLSNSVSSFFVNTDLHQLSPQQYSAFQNTRGARDAFEWEPVAAFQFDEKSETLQVDLDYKKPCKYVLIKPTNMRTSPKDFSAQFKTSPIEIRFIGVQGSLLDTNQSKDLLTHYYFSAIIDKRARNPFEVSSFLLSSIRKGSLAISVQEEQSSEWRILAPETLDITSSDFISLNEETTLKMPESASKLKEYCQKGLPISGHVVVEILDKSLKTKRVKCIRIEPLGVTSSQEWRVKSFGVELQIPKNSRFQLKSTPLGLRNWLLDLDFYPRFNRKLVKLLTNSDRPCKNVMNLLCELMERKGNDLTVMIYKDIDLFTFLLVNVLSENTSIVESRRFLSYFVVIPEFPKDLLNTLVKLLNELTNIPTITHMGLKAFLGLLGWCHNVDYEACFFELLGTLQNIAKRIAKVRSPNYNLLRVQYNISSLAFESGLFSSENAVFISRKKDPLKKNSPKITSITPKRNQIKAKTLIRKNSFGRKLLIDLGNDHALEALTLNFEKSDQTNVKLIVKVWAVDSNSGTKKLIHNDFYRESTFIQVSNFAFQEDNNKQVFSQGEKLNAIGFSGFYVVTRFIIVQITHSFFPAYKLANEQSANSTIIPEVFGSSVTTTRQNKAEPNKKLCAYIDLMNVKAEELKAINLAPTLQTCVEGTLYEIKDKKELFFFDSSASIAQKPIDSPPEDTSDYIHSLEIINEALVSDQAELSNKLFQYRTISVSPAEKNEIQELCENIEDLQLQKLALQSKLPRFEDKSLGDNLDFLYTIAIKLSRFLRRIDMETVSTKTAKSWRSNDWIQAEKGKFISLLLFETLVIHELLEPSEKPGFGIAHETIRLLTEVLIDNLNDREWQHFVIIILKKFLSQPVSIFSAPIDRLFSHNRLLHALDQISIPNGEVLAYLAYRLNIQFDVESGNISISRPPLLTNIPLEERKTQEVSALCQIVAILILLHRGFSKIPFDPSLDPKKIVHKGTHCFNCGQGKFITGTRLKCLNCPNLDSCNNGVCENKHLLLFPSHTFLFIEEPLPLAPSKRFQPEPISLAVPFNLVEPHTDVHGVNCENCNKDIVGVRMMCVNCEDFSLCKTCYELRNHTKFHIFVKLDNKIQVPPNSTPKCLVQFLDPLLYPLKSTSYECESSPAKKKLTKGISREITKVTTENTEEEQGEIKAIGLKKSVSSPARENEYLTFLKKYPKQGLNDPNKPLLKTVFEGDEDSLMLFPRFDYEDSLKITMQVCVWICECSSYSDCDKVYVLSLSFDLLMEIMKLSSMTGIKDLLANSSSFLKVFLSVLKLGSSSLLAKFELLLETFASPKNAPKTDENYLNSLNSYEKSRNLAEKLALDESRVLLVYHLQTVLHWVLDYALNPTMSTMYSQVFKETLAVTNWLEQISFVLELFLSCSEKLSKISKKQSQSQAKPPKRQPSTLLPAEESLNLQSSLANNDNLSPPGVNRSMSLPMDEQGKKPYAANNECQPQLETAKVQSLSLQTAINLIDLLFPKNQNNSTSRTGFNFSSSAKLWSLVFKAVLKVKVSVLAENNVFNSLINAFLLADEEIQHTMFQEILHLTQGIINHGSFQKEFSNSILSILFRFIRENMQQNSTSLHSFSSISFNLLKGWLDILLTKATPKPEDYYIKPLDKAFCRLNSQGALQLLDNISQFMVTHVNFGGRDGAQLSTETDIMKLNLADDMLKLLIFAESQNGVFAVSELFLSAKESQCQEITISIRRMLDWYLLNQSKECSSSPSTDLMLSLSTSCHKLFALAAESEQISRICIRELVASCREFDDLLVRRFRASQLGNYLSLSLNEQNCKILEELLDLWVTNDSLASFVAFEVKGFEFLLDRIGVQTISSGEKQEESIADSSKTSLLAGSDLLDYIQTSFYNEKNAASGVPSPPSLNKLMEVQKKKDEKLPQGQIIKAVDLKEEEFANKIYIVNQPGQHWSGIAPDWSLNKKGIRARILFFQMSNQFYSEYSLVLELDRVCEMKQLKIGFNTVWTDYNDKVLGVPSSILLEGGLNKNALTPLGTLELINDEGYSNYSVKVFKRNFQTFSTSNASGNGSRLDMWLKGVNNKQVKVIKLTFRRPIVTFVESLSMLSNKTYKNVCVAISFLSITGYDVAKVPGFVFNSLLETQKNSALQVLGKLCNANYNETLNTLAHREDVIAKIKSSFDFLSNLLVMHENWLAPVFLAIAHNQETGDFIINKFLDIEKSAPHAKMILEIILNNPAKAFPRVLQVFGFIKEKLNVQKKPSMAVVQSLNAVLHFIDTLTSALRLLTNENIINQELLTIPCSKEDIESLIISFEANSSNPALTKALVKLLVSLLFSNAPFVLSEPNLIDFALNHAYSLMKKTQKIAFYELFAQLIAGYQAASEWLFAENRLEELLATLTQHLDDFERSPENVKLTKAILQILNGAVCLDDSLKQYVLKKEAHLSIYNKMKQMQGGTILKISDNETLALLVEFIKSVALGYGRSEEKLADALKSDLSLLETRRDMQYVTQFLIPLLNAELNIPVCLHIFDSQSRKWLIEGRKMSKIQKTAPVVVQEAFGSKALTTAQRDSFEGMLKHMTTPSGLYNKVLKSANWELAVVQETDSKVGCGDQVFSKVLKAAPFILILEGTNNGKNCVTGVFSSQTVVENAVEDYAYEKIFNIPTATDNFLFYYEDDFCMHFNVPNYPGQNFLGHYHIFEDGGSGLSFHYNGQERIFVSFQAGTTTYVDVNLYDMKPIDENPKNFPGDIPADFQFRKCEFWVLKQQAASVSSGIPTGVSSKSDQMNFANILCPTWFNALSPLNLYRSSPVYNVPAAITVEKMSKTFFGAASVQLKSHKTKEKLKSETSVSDLWDFTIEDPNSNRILDLEFDVHELMENKSKEKPGSPIDKLPAYMPNMSIFEAFERCGGVNRIIEVILKSLSLWKNKARAKNWHAWVNELHSFSNLPHFFGLLMKNKECIELLFQLLKGTPDEEPEKALDKKVIDKKWEDEEQKAVRFSYKILSDVFKVDNNASIRDFALEKQLLDRFLDRIALISKESGRKYQEVIQEEKKEEEQKVEKKKEEDDGKKKIVKKKGIGYASDNTGQNQKWNISEYHESKKNQSEQLQSLLAILETFLDFNDWKPPKKFSDLVCTSALLPLIEAAFRSGSLLDMSKDSELFISFLRITRLFSRHSSLIPLLLDLDRHYVPKQTESIFVLLSNLKELATIFKSCMTADTQQTNETQVTDKLANEILSTYEVVEQAISEFQAEETNEANEESQMQDILHLPLPESYRTLLKDLRFDYTNMKDASNNYKHHYSSYIGKGPYTPPQAKIVRLAQELADLSTALPIEHTNSIFVRCDQTRVDVMKALIMGSAGTPYGHGAYEYDIYFDDNYPSGPPKVNLETTGAGRVRFNPNLYSCGKVCLSLLGTWRGNATENWDPKLSTLLQVLVSLQAIIMSEEVYFNEPGYEGEAGTEEGERKNEAYCNIVRYCNIKFAMIDQLKNPSKGFETVIRRHFYLKKQEIMEEVNKWLKYAQVRETSYTGLINDHNSSWCTQFKKAKESYYQMLKEAVTELETELNKLPAPSTKDVKSKKTVIKKGKQKKAENVAGITSGVMNLEEVDVSYEKAGTQTQKVLDISDPKVKDRWSRYIGAMGIEAVAKQANASVLLSGLSPLGVEIAKNVVLSGVKRFTLHDDQNCNYVDLSGQFFLNETDIGKNRAVASIEKIQQLNNYVKVDLLSKLKRLPKEEEELVALGLKEYTLVVICDSDYETQVAIDAFCRKNKIFFLSCDCNGPFGRVFMDLGEKFEVLDKNGEELQDLMIKAISNENEAKVELLQGSKHNLEDNDLVLITGVEGMELLADKQHPESNQKIIKQELLKNSINGSVHKVKVLNKSSFLIGDTNNYAAYLRNGIVKPIKSPVQLEFTSFAQALDAKDPPFDAMLSQHDFMKLENQLGLHLAYKALQEFKKKMGLEMPIPWDIDSVEEFWKVGEKHIVAQFKEVTNENSQEVEKIKRLLGLFALTSAGQFGALAAFLGGVVSQEIIKAITQKYMPIKQLFYTDCVEIVPDLPKEMTEWKGFIKDQQSKEFNIEKSRVSGVKICIGETLLQKLMSAKLFMVGAGAIGCELLKNYAMLSLGTGKEGCITLTDPDVIETSNLNRQFLFREKHLRKPKSSTAAASALQMNPLLKGHINARLDKVHEGTATIFTDKFFEDLTVVTNALDNVQARRYIDMRCVNSKTPLIESGTLGPKGHVQVVVPYKTESYGSQEDPQEDNEIPHCTLKMFPEETLHCVEWARDKFGKLFFQRPKNLMKIMEDLNSYVPTNSQELKNLREAVTFLKKRPLNFEDCVIYARRKFQKYFVNDIRQLLHTYPLNHKTKEGNPFWTLPKRPPVELSFVDNELLYTEFIAAFACLRATIFNIPVPKESRSINVKKTLAEKAKAVVVPDFKPNEEKSKAILTQVEEKPKTTGAEEVKEEPLTVSLDDYKTYINEIIAISKDFDKKNLRTEEFEKDNDENYHIDFIYALANCRARNYKLDFMDWVTVKIKAGRIIPALATTTASIAGLQTIELVKLMKHCKLDDMKNAFLNLAVPSLQLSEPGPPPIIKLTEDLKVNLWDRWDVKSNREITLRKLFEELKKTYGLWPKDAMNGSQAVYFAAIYNVPGKEKEREEALDRKLVETLGIEDEKYVNLTVTFAKDEKGEILKGTPPVRIYFE